jgi:circadian clock protein KaiB
MAKIIPKNTKVKTAAENVAGERYVLRLFITGILPFSVSAVKNVKAICEQYLKGRYDLEIIDIYQQPSIAREENILAVPVLVRKLPLPEVRIIGDLSDTKKVLDAFDL